MHLTRVNLGSIKKFFAYLQEGEYIGAFAINRVENENSK